MSKIDRPIWGWAMYDWANSAFATVVMAGFFPVFFKQFWNYGTDVNLSTARLGLANSIASLCVAVMAPVLGALADQGSKKKGFLLLFACWGVLATGLLAGVGRGHWLWAVLIYAAAVIGFSGANIFYDALLPFVAGEKSLDRVSSLGYAMGYLGGGLLFLADVALVMHPSALGFSDAAGAIRFSFVSVAAWWGGFTLFTFFWVPEDRPVGVARRPPRLVHAGFSQLAATFRQVRHLKTLSLFLLAYWFYIDGVGTVIRMALDYGMSIGFDAGSMIVALLIVQFVGFPAALLFGRLGSRWGVRKSILLAIGIYSAVTLAASMMTRRGEFFVLALAIGTVQGGIQALSRSFYARLIPARQAAQFYGFYNMFGKFAAIIGPVLVGGVSLGVSRLLLPPAAGPAQIRQTAHLAARWGIASVLLLFLAGAVLLCFVDERRGRAEAAELTTSGAPPAV